MCPGLRVEVGNCGSWFSPVSVWVLGTKLKSLGLVASILAAKPSHWPRICFLRHVRFKLPQLNKPEADPKTKTNQTSVLGESVTLGEKRR